MITKFNLFEKLYLDDVLLDVEQPDKSLLDNLIESLSLIIQKRIKRNLRILKISGKMNDLQIFKKERKSITDLKLEMSNKDILEIYYIFDDSIDKEPSGHIQLKVNNKVIYNMERKDFTIDKLIEKIVEQYKKYLEKNRWIIK